MRDNLARITNELIDLIERKNKNYGNSFGCQMDEYGILAATIRLDDKMSRLRSLTKGEPDKVGESIEDTVLDMMGYCLLTLDYLSRSSSNG